MMSSGRAGPAADARAAPGLPHHRALRDRLLDLLHRPARGGARSGIKGNKRTDTRLAVERIKPWNSGADLVHDPEIQGTQIQILTFDCIIDNSIWS